MLEMDIASLVSAMIGAKIGEVQLAVAGKLMRMDANQQQSAAKLLDAAQDNFDRLANVASGLGQNLDLSI